MKKIVVYPIHHIDHYCSIEYHESVCLNFILYLLRYNNNIIPIEEKKIKDELYKIIQRTLKKKKNKGKRIDLDKLLAKKIDKKKILKEEEGEVETDEDLEYEYQREE